MIASALAWERFDVRSRLRLSASTFAMAIATTVCPTSVIAADVIQPTGPDWYVGVFGGGSFARAHETQDGEEKIRLDDGFLLGGAIGRDNGHGVRSELEISYANNKNDRSRPGANNNYTHLSGDTSTLFVLGNVWRDIYLSDSMQPYVGAGLGIGFLQSENQSDDQDWDVDGAGLAGQLGAGIRFALTERLAVDAGYRLRSVIDVSSTNGMLNDNSSFSYYSHGVQLGASYSLGEDSRIMAAQDEPGLWYVSLFAGATFTETNWNYDGSSFLIDHKTGFTVGAALGTHIAPELRAEIELSYAVSKLKDYSGVDTVVDDASGQLEQTFILANVWKDFDWGWITPYIGGGVGVGILHLNHAELDQNDISDDTQFGLAGQFGVGARVAVGENMSVGLGYRFKSILDVLLDGDPNSNHENSQVSTHDHVIQADFNWGLGETITPVAGVTPEVNAANYVSVFAGVLLPEDSHANIHGHDYLVKFDTGFTVGAAVGGNIMEDLRGDVELSYQRFDVNEVEVEGFLSAEPDGDVDGYFLLANLWRDFEIGGIRPYVGGGVGLALMDVHIAYETGCCHKSNHTDLALAAQAGTGLRFRMTDSLTMDVGYRFKGALGVVTEGNSDWTNTSTYYAHIGQAGVQWAY